MSTGAGLGSQYQVVVRAKGSPEFSSECIPDVNWVLPAAAGHTERNTERLRPGTDCQRKGRKPGARPSPLPSEGHTEHPLPPSQEPWQAKKRPP